MYVDICIFCEREVTWVDEAISYETCAKCEDETYIMQLIEIKLNLSVARVSMNYNHAQLTSGTTHSTFGLSLTIGTDS